MKWKDVEDIAEKLEEKHPDFDIISVRYTLLKKMVCELDDFEDEENLCNEKILEAIQAEWINHRNEK